LLQARGAAVVDTDELARQVVLPGQPALTEVRAAFGAAIIGPDAQIRRDALAEIVFADAAARKKLEDILHPRIRELWRAQLQACATRADAGRGRDSIVVRDEGGV